MNPARIVIGEPPAVRGPEVFPLPAEGVGQPRHAAHLHPNRKVLALHIFSGSRGKIELPRKRGKAPETAGLRRHSRGLFWATDGLRWPSVSDLNLHAGSMICSEITTVGFSSGKIGTVWAIGKVREFPKISRAKLLECRG